MSDTSYKVGGIFTFQHIRDGKIIDEWESRNIIVNQGLNYILGASLAGDTPLTAWYVGLFKNNYSPLSTDTQALFPGVGVGNEATTEYSEATRPLWVDAGAASQSITNSASPAVFTFVSPVTIYGALLSSNSTKGGTTGTLLAASKFSSSKVMAASDSLNIGYTITASST